MLRRVCRVVIGTGGRPHASLERIQKNTQLHDSSGPQPPMIHLLSPKAQRALSRGLADAMWAAAIVEALDLDPFVRTRLVGYHASVGRLVALIMLTHVSRLLQRRELPGSILGSSVFSFSAD